MTIERKIRAMAGTVILVSLALAVFVNLWWLLLTTFVGANLLQSAFTGICPAGSIFKAISGKPSCCSGSSDCCEKEEAPASKSNKSGDSCCNDIYG